MRFDPKSYPRKQRKSATCSDFPIAQNKVKWSGPSHAAAMTWFHCGLIEYECLLRAGLEGPG